MDSRIAGLVGIFCKRGQNSPYANGCVPVPGPVHRTDQILSLFYVGIRTPRPSTQRNAPLSPPTGSTLKIPKVSIAGVAQNKFTQSVPRPPPRSAKGSTRVICNPLTSVQQYIFVIFICASAALHSPIKKQYKSHFAFPGFIQPDLCPFTKYNSMSKGAPRHTKKTYMIPRGTHVNST